MIATLVLVIITLILIVVLFKLRSGKNSLPGPFPWPLIGNRSLLKSLSRDLGGQHLAFLELSKRYDSDVIALSLGSKDVVVVSGNRLIQYLLTNEDFDGRPWNEFIKMRNMGMKKGITMNDGYEWKELRSWLVRTFRTVGFGKRAMSDMIKDELAMILGKIKDGGVHQMKATMAPVVINVLWTLATGKRLDDSRLRYFMNLLAKRGRIFDMCGGLLTTFPWIRYIAPEISGYNILQTLNNDLKNLLQETITQHKKNYVAGSERDLIDMFLREMYNNEESSAVFTDDQLVMMLVDLFIAGCSTTTTSLSFAFVAMCVEQKIQGTLQKEIDSVIPSDRLPDLEDRPKLPYVEAILTETHRMWSVTPITGPRRTLRNTKLGNYDLEKNTEVLINVYSVHMDENLHPEPHIFKPERYLKNGAYEPNECVLGFGKGKRRCPGEVLAKSALFLLFVGVMQRFKILPVPGKGPTKVEANQGLILTPKSDEVLLVPR